MEWVAMLIFYWFWIEWSHLSIPLIKKLTDYRLMNFSFILFFSIGNVQEIST